MVNQNGMSTTMKAYGAASYMQGEELWLLDSRELHSSRAWQQTHEYVVKATMAAGWRITERTCWKSAGNCLGYTYEK